MAWSSRKVYWKYLGQQTAPESFDDRFLSLQGILIPGALLSFSKDLQCVPFVSCRTRVNLIAADLRQAMGLPEGNKPDNVAYSCQASFLVLVHKVKPRFPPFLIYCKNRKHICWRTKELCYIARYGSFQILALGQV